MPRPRFVAPMVLLSLAGGLLRSAAPPLLATAGTQAYAGTVTVAGSFFVPAIPAMVGYNFGLPFLFDSPITLDGHDHYSPDLAARVPTSSNGDIRIVGGNEVVTVRLKPGMRWTAHRSRPPTTSAR
jgi:hypothetical protein